MERQENHDLFIVLWERKQCVQFFSFKHSEML